MKTMKLAIVWLFGTLNVAVAQGENKQYITMFSNSTLSNVFGGFVDFDEVIENFATQYNLTFDRIKQFRAGDRDFDVSSFPPRLARFISRLPFVDSIEIDHKIQHYGQRFRLLQPSSETVPYGINLIQSLGFSGVERSDRKVCIIDSGYDIVHPDLPSAGVTGSSVAANWFQDLDEVSHGTHVAGTVAALGGNGRGVVGVIPDGNIKLHIVAVFGPDGASFSGLVESLEACRAAGSHVVSMSLGGDSHNMAVKTTMDSMYNEGILLVASAGNDGSPWYNYPASYDSAVSVAAVDSFKRVASFSQYNNQVELSAPGVDVLSTVAGGGYALLDGTSMSCPHVSGVAALVWSLFPDKTAQEIRGVLQVTAEDLGASGYDVDYGFGLVRADLAVAYLRGNFPIPDPLPLPGESPEAGECTDSPADWADSDGDSCATFYYDEFACATFGDGFHDPVYNLSANDVCCVCGGGTSGCVDDPPDWEDSFGDGCDWYEVDNRCAEFGLTFTPVSGITAIEACCVCQGVVPSSLGALDKETPRDPSIIIEPSTSGIDDDDDDDDDDFGKKVGIPVGIVGALAILGVSYYVFRGRTDAPTIIPPSNEKEHDITHVEEDPPTPERQKPKAEQVK